MRLPTRTLCLHEWSLTTERFDGGVDRGSAYKFLTAHQELTEARIPTTWERNRIDLLFLEGFEFTCPWTSKRLAQQTYQFDLGSRVLGSEEEARLWLSSPILSLGSGRPIGLLETVKGYERVENALLQNEYGTF